jgi:hypothetical protein
MGGAGWQRLQRGAQLENGEERAGLSAASPQRAGWDHAQPACALAIAFCGR